MSPENGEKIVQVAVLPPGYHAAYAQGETDGEQVVEWCPVLALGLQRNGGVVYLVHDQDGRPEPAHSAENFVMVHASDKPPGRFVRDGQVFVNSRSSVPRVVVA